MGLHETTTSFLMQFLEDMFSDSHIKVLPSGYGENEGKRRQDMEKA